MKKWDEPKLFELNLKNTNESRDGIDFESYITLYNPYGKKCPSASGQDCIYYKKGGNGNQCEYFDKGYCTYDSNCTGS